MSPKEISERLAELLGEEAGLVFKDEQAGDPWAQVAPEHWHSACLKLRDDPELSFGFLRSLSAVDRPETEELELVVHLFSYAKRHAFVLKTRLPRVDGQVGTVCDVWPAANWHEREVFDLFGLGFVGHPDLRRLLLPDDWEGHPLLKDYQEAESYRGIPTQRPGYPIQRGSK